MSIESFSPLPLNVFGTWVTLLDPSDVPAGRSPSLGDVEFPPRPPPPIDFREWVLCCFSANWGWFCLLRVSFTGGDALSCRFFGVPALGFGPGALHASGVAGGSEVASL